jgi:hypothetical protein
LFGRLVFLDLREKREMTAGLVRKESEVLVEKMAFRAFRDYKELLERRVNREIGEPQETEERLDGLVIQETRVCRE